MFLKLLGRKPAHSIGAHAQGSRPRKYIDTNDRSTAGAKPADPMYECSIRVTTEQDN